MNNTNAMNFLNLIAGLQEYSEAYCNRTGMDYRDGLLWHIADKATKIYIDCVGNDTIWQFKDLSLLVANGDPTNFEDTQDIHLRLMAVVEGVAINELPSFYSGCGKETGFFYKGKLVQPEKSKESFIPPCISEFSFKEVIESIIKPTIPEYTSEELASDHEKAQHYLMARTKDVQDFAAAKVLKWERVNMAEEKAKFYEAGHVHKHAGWSNWGKLIFNDNKRQPVRFATYECFVAWTLKGYY